MSKAGHDDSFLFRGHRGWNPTILTSATPLTSRRCTSRRRRPARKTGRTMLPRRRNSPDVVTSGGGLPPPIAKQQSQRTMMQPFPSSPSTASVKASGPPSGLSNFLARGVKLFGRSTSITKSPQPSPRVDASQPQQRPEQNRIRQRNVSGPTLPRAPPSASQNGPRLLHPASRSVHLQLAHRCRLLSLLQLVHNDVPYRGQRYPNLLSISHPCSRFVSPIMSCNSLTPSSDLF